MSIQSLSNTTTTIERKTVTADALGIGHVETFASVYTNVAMSLQPANGRTIDEFLREGFHVTHMAYTARAMTLLMGDRFNHGGKYYIVQGKQRNMAGRDKAYSIPVLEKDQ